MGYIDLRRREVEGGRVAWDPRRSGNRSITVGGILVLPAALLSYGFSGGPASPADVLLFWIPTIAFVLRGIRQLRGVRSAEPGIGGEKQLLLALRDLGGGITPVEAALETSLSVDEADRLLSRLAERGHLLVESRDGALLYALPGRRFG